MKKAIAIALIGLMALSAIGMMPVKAGTSATTLQAYTIAAYGDNTMNWYESSVGYRGNITGCDLTNPSYGHPISPEAASDFGSGIVAFSWDATGSPPQGWSTPPESGDTLALICEIPDHPIGAGDGSDPYNAIGSQNGVNYTWALFGKTWAANFWPQQADFMGRPEPIPGVDKATSTPGDTYINIQIPHFKYTDYNNTLGGSSGRGTYEAWHSYAVFYSTSPNGPWTYFGNTNGNISGADSPIPAYGDNTDPSTIDTGYATVNVTGLTSNTDYYFQVRPNFIGTGGYQGGLGSYTTYGASAVVGPITTTPEFTTILLPIVAVIGMFMVATYAYRRKK